MEESRTINESFINERYPRHDQRSEAYRKELVRVCVDFIERGLADPKFIRELTSGQDSKFWACISEALIADQLRSKIFSDRSSYGKGPDFLVMDGSKKVWIEVVCPEPTGILTEWLKFHKGSTGFPHVEILLRWTAAIKEKAEKLIGNPERSIKGYLQKKTVGPNDAYVIAVNGCQLRNGPSSALFGISQLPFAAEAVFPVGPMQLTLDRESLKVEKQGHQHRPFIINRNKAQVPAYTFLDPKFKTISAIWAVDLKGDAVIGNAAPMAVIHNPNATTPISLGFLPTIDEYVATPSNENEYLLQNIKN